ncbi:ABC transporter permease [Aurantibacter crassamenti]|uniref:ABC transporter permease n=1 Tax=Aurantibacter crassamenti TaxID=1837375 RepID=UPI00193A93E5|nr:ABC transporter permease [Aurantibacter crassamenti]MBM1106008.1 ABC transporter permease [Aurantibacter crassamenti]
MWLLDRDLWTEILNTLSKNMFRTFLTMLGVFFAMIILLLLLGATNGMSNSFDKIFEGTSSNSLFMWSQQTSEPYKGFERGRRIRFTTDDVELLKKQIPEIDIISPRIQLGGYNTPVSVYRNGRTSGSSVLGDYPLIDEVTKKNIVEGRFLNNKDIEYSKKVCVIGQEAYEQLFDKGEEAIGHSIRVNGVFFTVIGIYKKNENIDIDGDNAVFIPFTTCKKTFGGGNQVGFMAMTIYPEYTVPPIEAKIKKLLKNKYSIHPDDERAIGSFDMSRIFNSVSAFTGVLNGFSFFVGIFTLLAGIIAVSNILLITVKERTKEIGIRRALGATPRVVKRQIVLEAILITVFAGLLGFTLSTAILAGANVIFEGMENVPITNAIFSIPQFLISFFLLVVLSVLIGLIPANRAVKVKPIDALREE